MLLSIIYSSFLITHGTKEEWQRHNPATLVPLKHVKLHSHNRAATSFLPGKRLSLAGRGGPLKATECLRWEEALPAEGSAMSKCHCCRAVINRQWWQPVVPQPRSPSPSRKNLAVRRHLATLAACTVSWKGAAVCACVWVEVSLDWTIDIEVPPGLRKGERRCISHGCVTFILEEIWRGFRPQRLLNSH